MSKSIKVQQPAKSLNELIILHDEMPGDFYENTALYQQQLSIAIYTAKSLTHEISEDGRKLAKADAALIRKYAATTDKFALSVFRKLTDSANTWRDGFKSKTKELNAAADDIMYRFEEIEKEKLAQVKAAVNEELYSARKGIDFKFINKDIDLSSLVKLTGTLTPGGKLTTKAIAFITSIAQEELSRQQRYEKRVMEVENRCLRVDINPPLAPVHFGNSFEADDVIFNAKLDELITAEINRRAEMEANIIKKQEAQKQREIQAAVEAERKAEADRQTKERQEASRLMQEGQERAKAEDSKPTPNDNRTAPWSLKNAAHGRAVKPKPEQPADRVETKPTDEYRTLYVEAVFKFECVSKRVSDQALETFFKNQLNEKMQAILVEVEVKKDNYWEQP